MATEEVVVKGRYARWFAVGSKDCRGHATRENALTCAAALAQQKREHPRD